MSKKEKARWLDMLDVMAEEQNHRLRGVKATEQDDETETHESTTLFDAREAV